MDKDTNKKDGIPREFGNRVNWKWADARTLHETFGNGRDFSTWIKRRIRRYGLIEGKDYEVYFKPEGISHRYNLKEYLLSPETAEKLVAVQNSRKYFKNAQISTFTFSGKKLNVFPYNGELWFFGVDICDLLKISRKNPSNIIKDGQMVIITSLAPGQVPTPYIVVNEWGLLWFVLRSKKGKSLEASKWLIKEALPQIRKAYAIPLKELSLLGRIHRYFKSLCNRSKETQDEQA